MWGERRTRLIYVARTRNGFTPVSRAQLFKKFKGLETRECPYVNLPEARSGRWGQGLTKAKMAECVWLKPVLVGQFEFSSGPRTTICGTRSSWAYARTRMPGT
jgi:bifunctional non-homologous end joining protein LigD